MRGGRERGMNWAWRLVAPSVVFGVVAAVELIGSGAPARVHALALSCAWVGVWLSGVVAGRRETFWRRLPWWSPLVLASMVAWDALSYLVVLKNESFGILLGEPWVYVVGFAALSTVVFLTASLTSILLARAQGRAGASRGIRREAVPSGSNGK